jgi:hypothetical protein
MTDPISIALVGTSVIAAIGAASLASLKAWGQWLDFKRLELAAYSHGDGPPLPETAGRIELADLKERVRKLEAIASGIDI